MVTTDRRGRLLVGLPAAQASASATPAKPVKAARKPAASDVNDKADIGRRAVLG
jgi:hypothetical protein